jgi:2-polyprenyl-3-methyl-5-hydroxy-6-metoxy-1,4-benzoquinol methylase
MNDLKDCVVKSLDGTALEIFPFLPYLLQDLREIGTDPLLVSEMLHEHIDDIKPIKILDFGCGKGAVSVRLAKDYNCQIFGIDALPEFVESAKEFAIEKGVYDRCLFSQGDIRTQYIYYKNFDVVILGAIGPVLGNIEETLQKVSQCLKSEGIVVLDDSYIPESSDYAHERSAGKLQFFEQISQAGFEVSLEQVLDVEYIKLMNREIFSKIKYRANEMISQYPHKAKIIQDYVKQQNIENFALENNLVCSLFLLTRV